MNSRRRDVLRMRSLEAVRFSVHENTTRQIKKETQNLTETRQEDAGRVPNIIEFPEVSLVFWSSAFPGGGIAEAFLGGWTLSLSRSRTF